jgi:hypothetical protein
MPHQPFDAGFGVEIECYMPEGATTQQCAAAIQQRIGKPVQYPGYTHRRMNEWKIVPDGSLGNYARGIELVSPVLHGQEGITEIEKVARALADFGCSVNKSCGYHVHVGIASFREPGDTTEWPLRFMKRLLEVYAVYEPIIDSVMPPSRRASTNTYCRSMTGTSLVRVDAAQDLISLVRASTAGNFGDMSRYYKLNLIAWMRHKTVEFRQHAGTLDPMKVRYWTMTCLRMVAAARNGATTRAVTSAPAGAAAAAVIAASQVNRAREGSKTWQIGQMMLRPEGVTGPEACQAVGWPSVSMPEQARICGLTVTTQRIGRTVRYFARTTQAETTAMAEVAPPPQPVVIAPAPAITLPGLLDLIGASLEEREYFQQRQADLGGPIAWAA